MKSLVITVLMAVGLFCSCQSYRLVGIETYNPASIMFPPEIKTVMIVNNAAQQPDNEGHQLIDVRRPVDSTYSVSTDSMAYHFCLSLGKAIAESPIFDDVRLCEDTLRTDSLYFYKKPFTVNEVKRFCDEYKVDALITLDKFYFNTILMKGVTQANHLGSFLMVEVTGEMKVIWPGQNQAFTIPFNDSLKWTIENEPNVFHVIEEFTMSDLRFAIRYLSEHTGQKMHAFVVPYWSTDKRWYYTSALSSWKRATAYAAGEKWALAANEWQSLYAQATNNQQKARLASNLAFAQEMTGSFARAYEYAETAYRLFQEFTDEGDFYRKRQKSYLELLKKRLDDEGKLSEQLRED